MFACDPVQLFLFLVLIGSLQAPAFTKPTGLKTYKNSRDDAMLKVGQGGSERIIKSSIIYDSC